eukprot:COSAG06_NODE_3718_length_4977_cov_4.743542_4_plen_170_part_00
MRRRPGSASWSCSHRVLRQHPDRARKPRARNVATAPRNVPCALAWARAPLLLHNQRVQRRGASLPPDPEDGMPRVNRLTYSGCSSPKEAQGGQRRGADGAAQRKFSYRIRVAVEAAGSAPSAGRAPPGPGMLCPHPQSSRASGCGSQVSEIEPAEFSFSESRESRNGHN